MKISIKIYLSLNPYLCCCLKKTNWKNFSAQHLELINRTAEARLRWCSQQRRERAFLFWFPFVSFLVGDSISCEVQIIASSKSQKRRPINVNGTLCPRGSTWSSERWTAGRWSLESRSDYFIFEMCTGNMRIKIFIGLDNILSSATVVDVRIIKTWNKK